MDQRWVHERDRSNKGMFCTWYACSRYRCPLIRSTGPQFVGAVGAKERTGAWGGRFPSLVLVCADYTAG